MELILATLDMYNSSDEWLRHCECVEDVGQSR